MQNHPPLPFHCGIFSCSTWTGGFLQFHTCQPAHHHIFIHRNPRLSPNSNLLLIRLADSPSFLPVCLDARQNRTRTQKTPLLPLMSIICLASCPIACHSSQCPSGQLSLPLHNNWKIFARDSKFTRTPHSPPCRLLRPPTPTSQVPHTQHHKQPQQTNFPLSQMAQLQLNITQMPLFP